MPWDYEKLVQGANEYCRRVILRRALTIEKKECVIRYIQSELDTQSPEVEYYERYLTYQRALDYASK